MCDFVCIVLLLPFVLGFCLSVFFFVCLFCFFSIVFRICYHWWICFWFGCSLLSFFKITFKKLFLIIIFYFNNFFIYFILFYFLFFFLSFFRFPLLFWAVWKTGSWCSSQATGLCCWGGRTKFRTLVHKRTPSSM